MDLNVLLAFGVTLAAGLATVIGWLVVVRGNSGNPRLLAFGLAFAAGAMIYVSLAEIFVKSQLSFDAWLQNPGGQSPYAMATLMLFIGMGLVIILDRFVPNPHGHLDPGHIEPGAPNPVVARAGLLAAAAITAHNIPEGLATFFSTYQDPSVGYSLAVAIAVHNIPEGVTIALPIFYATGSRSKALLWTVVSALAEPLGAIIGYILLQPLLNDPSLQHLAFGSVFGLIAGAMVFLSLDELLPTAKRYAKGHETVYGMVIGMALLAASLVLFK